MTQDTPSRALDKIIVRLPDGMRDRLKQAADANNRSVNSEVVSRLDASFDGPDAANTALIAILASTLNHLLEYTNHLQNGREAVHLSPEVQKSLNRLANLRLPSASDEE